MTTSTSSSFNTQPPEGGWIRRHIFAPVEHLFQHTAARRRLEAVAEKAVNGFMFQHTAARRRLEAVAEKAVNGFMFQHTAARRRLGYFHVRCYRVACFNTQPPEGGWYKNWSETKGSGGFNTQPPEGGWCTGGFSREMTKEVSTHSRPKAAGLLLSSVA